MNTKKEKNRTKAGSAAALPLPDGGAAAHDRVCGGCAD